MIKVGISGKIAAGKSEVEKILLDMNYPVYDLDNISHNLLNDNEQIKVQILDEFNTLDRKELANIVFNDELKKQKLENIIYPELKKEVFNIFEKHKKDKFVFISGALLFKSGFYKLFDKTIYVEAEEKIRLERLMKRNNLLKETALARLNLQDDGNCADIIIENNYDVSDLRKEIIKLIAQI